MSEKETWTIICPYNVERPHAFVGANFFLMGKIRLPINELAPPSKEEPEEFIHDPESLKLCHTLSLHGI